MAKDSRLDTARYESAKTYLKAAFEHLIAAGQDVRKLVEFASERFGDTFVPHMRQFLSDVHEGRISIQGLTESAKMAVLGRQITAEEREALIREAAYLRAEQRGFVGGSPEEDWHLAEQEIDQRLAAESGLVVKGRRALSSAASNLEQELDGVKDVIARWLEGKGGADTQSGSAKTVRKKAVASKSTPVRKKAAPKEKPAAKKPQTATAPSKKVATKKTAKKKTSGSGPRPTKAR